MNWGSSRRPVDEAQAARSPAPAEGSTTERARSRDGRRVDPARHRQPYQVEGRPAPFPRVGSRRPPEHVPASQLRTPLATYSATVSDQAGKPLVGRAAGRRRGVDVHGVAAEGLQNGHARGGQLLAEPADLGDAVGEVRLVEHLVERTAMHSRSRPASPPADGIPSLTRQPDPDPLRPAVVIERDHAPGVAERVLLHAHEHAVGKREDVAGDRARAAAPWSASRRVIR